MKRTIRGIKTLVVALLITAVLTVNTYAVAVDDSSRGAAVETIYSLIGKLDITANLTESKWAKEQTGVMMDGTDYSNPALTDEQRAILKQVALDVTKDCKTQYDKIKAIAIYVADRTYYDFLYAKHGVKDVYVNPYSVYTQKRTVCDGYNSLVRELLYLLEIPSIDFETSRDSLHIYTGAYDSGNKRWIVFDATWMCSNTYDYNSAGTPVFTKGNGVNMQYFDMSAAYLATLDHHDIAHIENIVDDRILYGFDATYGFDSKQNWNNYDWKLSVIGADVSLERIFVPKAVNGVPVKSVAELAFANIAAVKEIIIAGEVESIDNFAFAICSNLEILKLPSTVTSLGMGCFNACNSLSIYLPDNITSVGDYAFGGVKKIYTTCGSTTAKTLSSIATNNVEVVHKYSNGVCVSCGDAKPQIYTGSCGSACTYNMNESTGVLTISGKGTIDNNAFVKYRNNIKKIVIGEGITGVEAAAFMDLPELSEVTIPSTMTEFGSYSFYNTPKLAYLKFSQNITSLGYEVIGGATKYYATCGTKANDYLVSAKISHATAHTLGDNYYCKSCGMDLATVSGSCGGNTKYSLNRRTGKLVISGTGAMQTPGYASYKSLVKDVVVEQGVTGLCDNAFYPSYTNIKTLTLPMSVTAFGQSSIPNGIIMYAMCGTAAANSFSSYRLLEVNHLYSNGVCILCGDVQVMNGVKIDKNNVVKYYKNGEVDRNFTDIAYYDNQWYYLENGIQNDTYKGLVNHNGTLWYVANGKLDKNFSGYASLNSTTYRVVSGKADTAATGLTLTNGIWAYCKAGVVQTSYTGLVYYGNDWWYVTNGYLDKAFKGITSMNGKQWFIRNGKISRENGVVIQDGNIYKIVNGAVDTSVTALDYVNGKWYYFRKGIVDWTYNTLAYANNQWWYINKGELDKTYTGLVLYANQLWYVTEGKLDKTYVGKCVYQGKTYTVSGGIGR